MSHKYGLSFNCNIEIPNEHDYEDVGGETQTLDMVGNDIEKLQQKVITNDSSLTPVINNNHKFIGWIVEGSGKIVSVLEYGNGDDDILCVIFTEPNEPTIVE